MAKNPKFVELLREIEDLHDRKNDNYAGTGGDPLKNFRESERFGVDAFKGVLVRLSDKWSRVCNLAGGIPDLVGESLRDTLIDQAVYSLIAVLLLEESMAKKCPIHPWFPAGPLCLECQDEEGRR